MKKITAILFLLTFGNAVNAEVLTFDTFTFNVNPILSSGTAASFYSYGSPLGASANTGFEKSNTLVSFLFEGSDGLSQFFIYDSANDGTGGFARTAITSTGLAGNGDVGVTVRDDPGDDPYSWNTATGSMTTTQSWVSCCTDGFVLGGITADTWSLTSTLESFSGITNIEFRDADGVVANVSAADVTSFTYSAVPEPESLLLLGVGLLGLSLRRRQFRKAS